VGSFSPLHLLILLLFVPMMIVLTIWPTVIILRRMGYSGWWAALKFAPFGTIIGLWILAQSRWPKFDGPSAGIGKTFD